MYIGFKIVKEFEILPSDTNISVALEVMEEKSLWKVLVSDADNVIGYVRKDALKKLCLNGGHKNLSLANVVRRDISIVAPEAEIEIIADMMATMYLSLVCVADKDGKIMGYVTHHEMLRLLSEYGGYGTGDERLVVEVNANRRGIVYEISGVICNTKKDILAINTFTIPEGVLIVIHVASEDVRAIRDILIERGYKLVTAQNYQNAW